MLFELHIALECMMCLLQGLLGNLVGFQDRPVLICHAWLHLSLSGRKSATRYADKKKGGKACKKSAVSGDNGRINLDMETLSVLGKMRLPVPSTVGDIPGLVEKINVKKEEYESKQKRKLKGEAVAEDVDEDEDSGDDGAGTSNGAVNGSHMPVNVSMRCDEAFGQVIVEIVAN